MKKSIVAGLIILAVIVIVSPGLVGFLAERSVDSQLEWAADESQEILVRAAGFDRGWFSSAGEHRVEFAPTGAGARLRQQLGFGEAGNPALVINTRLDHGLIPLSSMNRDDGSLKPGLGRAISRLSIDNGTGRVTPLPGVVYTEVGLTGAVNSHYILEPGGAEETSWGAADITVRTSANQDDVRFDGHVDAVTIAGGNEQVATGAMTFSGDLAATGFGFSVGDFALNIASITITSVEQQVTFEPLTVRSHSSLRGGRVDADVSFAFTLSGLADVNTVSWTMQAALTDIDGASLGRVLDGLEKSRHIDDATQAFALVEPDLTNLFAEGFSIDIAQMDLTLPQGTMKSSLQLAARESAANPLVRTGLLLALEANAEVVIPAALFDYIAIRNPGFQSAAAMGFLKNTGENYELVAEYRKGLLTVNGAPMPIPMPGR